MKKNHNRAASKQPVQSTLQPAPTSNPAPTAELKPGHYVSKDPEKIDDLLKAAHLQIPDQNSPAVAAPAKSTASAAPSNAQAKADVSDAKRRVAFKLQRPARSVKVAGDFTHWDQAPVEMTAAGQDQWSAVLQLEPGEYAYRFIVDGQWCEDPHCHRHVPNGFGSENSVIVVR